MGLHDALFLPPYHLTVNGGVHICNNDLIVEKTNFPWKFGDHGIRWVGWWVGWWMGGLVGCLVQSPKSKVQIQVAIHG